MGQDGTDFEKGDAEGTTDALAVLEGIVAGLIGTYGFHWERGPLAKFMASVGQQRNLAFAMHR